MVVWGFTVVDLVAVAFFVVSWIMHFWVINRSPLKVKTISHHMNLKRVDWMRAMMNREPRMFDALIQNGFQHGVLFFASTSILIVGALLAGLGATEEAIDMLIDLPFSSATTRTVWEIKLLLVTLIFVFSFFKFAWSYRQFNYVMILVGAAPERGALAKAEEDTYIHQLATLHGLAALHFTTGLNAYFFALAVFAWFLNAWLFIVATVWVSLVMYRRAFGSKFVGYLINPADAGAPRNRFSE